jgi:hypothetical protein
MYNFDIKWCKIDVKTSAKIGQHLIQILTQILTHFSQKLQKLEQIFLSAS